MANNDQPSLAGILPDPEATSPDTQREKWYAFMKRASKDYGEPLDTMYRDSRTVTPLAATRNATEAAYTPSVPGASTVHPLAIVMAILPYVPELGSADDPLTGLVPGIDRINEKKFVLKCYPYKEATREMYPPEEIRTANPAYINLLPAFEGFGDDEKNKPPVFGDVVKVSYRPGSYLRGHYEGPAGWNMMSQWGSQETAARRSAVSQFKSPKPKYDIGPDGTIPQITGSM